MGGTKIWHGAVALLVLAVVAVASPARAENFKMTAAAGHPPIFLWVKLLHEFYIPEINKRLAADGGKHTIAWTEAYGGTVAKIGGVLEAIEEGIVDIGFVGSIFEAPKLPLQNVTYVSPFGTADIGLVTRTIAGLQKSVPAMGAAWGKYNQMMLTGAALDTYHIFTTFPIKSIDDLKGRKILAPGPSANWVKGTGAVAVAGNLKTYYNDIKTGVADGTLTFTTGAWGCKCFEVAPHITKVNFGSQFAGGLSINKDVWASFPADVKKIFLEVSAEYDVRFAKGQQAAADKLLGIMVKKGAKVAVLPAAERKRWAQAIPNVAKAWAAGLEKKGLPGKAVLKGYMQGLAKAGVDVPRDWSAE